MLVCGTTAASQGAKIIDPTLGNRLLAGLPRVERQALLAHAQLVTLTAPSQLDQGHGVRHAWFPVDCTISLLVPAGRRDALEIGAVGCEGLFGPQSEAEVDWFELRGFVQSSGRAWRIESATLQHLCASQERLNALLLRYLHVLLVQTARSVACCRFHSLEQRLARWLLAHGDRAWSQELAVTHDQLAMLLGARRAGVTVAAGQLEQRGVVGCGRGRIAVLDRAGLLQVACPCYIQDRQTYEHAMGVPPERRRY